MVIGMAIGSGLLFVTLAAPATAQSPIEIRATAPEKPQQLRIVEPSEATRQSTRPREADFYREDVRVRHEPAFIEPFVGQTQGGTIAGALGPERMARTGNHGGMGFGAGGLDPARVQSSLSRGA